FTALSDSVRVVVMLGHSGCGAVSGAVDAYLRPVKFWSKSMSPMLRSLIQRIFVAVSEGANGLKEVWGNDARDIPGYREALIESAVSINVAQAAFDLRQEVERNGKWEVEVLYGVHKFRRHQVCMPVDPMAAFADKNVRLAHAPTNPKDFHALAIEMAQILAPKKNVSSPAVALTAISVVSPSVSAMDRLAETSGMAWRVPVANGSPFFLIQSVVRKCRMKI